MGSERRFTVGGVELDRPFQVMRLGHVGFYVEDLARSNEFYGHLLGYHVTDVLAGRDGTPDPAGRFYTYNSDHHALVLIDVSVGLKRAGRYGRGITLNQASFQVNSLHEVVEAHRHMQGAGREIWRIGRDVPGSNWAVYVKDPDGHPIELFYGMEQIGWDRRSKPVDHFRPFALASEPRLPAASEQDEVTGVEAVATRLDGGTAWTDETATRFDVGGVLLPRPFKVVDAGPIRLFVADMAASVAFFRDELGLSVTEELDVRGFRATFLRIGAEHHTVALFDVGLRAELDLEPSTTVASYSVQVGSWEQLRAAVSHFEHAGAPRVAVPPEFHQGIPYAAHFRDPDGHLVELYFEMESVDWHGARPPLHLRRQVTDPWPEVLPAGVDTYRHRGFQGPLG